MTCGWYAIKPGKFASAHTLGNDDYRSQSRSKNQQLLPLWILEGLGGILQIESG